MVGRPASADGTSMDLDAISKSVQSHLDSQDPDRIKKCYDFLQRRMREIIQEMKTTDQKKVTVCKSKQKVPHNDPRHRLFDMVLY